MIKMTKISNQISLYKPDQSTKIGVRTLGFKVRDFQSIKISLEDCTKL